MQLKKRFKPYFSFTQNERKGLVVLTIILLVVFIIRLIIPYLLNYEKVDSITLKTLIFNIKTNDSLKSNKNPNLDYTNDPFHQNLLEGEKIDPNKATTEELMAAGFSKKVVNNIIKYRKSGGIFYKLNDIKRIYGLESNQFNRVKNYLSFDKSYIKPYTIKENRTVPIEKLNINKADSLQFLKINGITADLARRIFKYREMLGGYKNMEQLKEVYGISPQSYEHIKDQIFIDSLLIKKLNINNITLIKLKKHPYISDFQAEAILKYRNFSHGINSINELLNNKIFTKEEFVKIAPYLVIQ
jgi:competence protein ComEA